MSQNEFATHPIPSTYEAAAALVQNLGESTADLLWAAMSEEQAQALLHHLAGIPPEEAETPFADLAAQAVPQTPSRGIQFQERHPLSEAPLPRLSEPTLLHVLETAPDALVVIDARGLMVLVNAQTESLFGYPPAGVARPTGGNPGAAPHSEPTRAAAPRHLPRPRIRAMGTAGRPLFGLTKTVGSSLSKSASVLWRRQTVC